MVAVTNLTSCHRQDERSSVTFTPPQPPRPIRSGGDDDDASNTCVAGEGTQSTGGAP